MRGLSWAGVSAAALALFGCGGPVPGDMYLTMSVSTQDVGVVTSINGNENDFLSGASGSMTSSIPLNKFVKSGTNSATFVVSPVSADMNDKDPGLFAALEISLQGEMVDTLDPGERTMFIVELDDDQKQNILAGETVTITETFIVDKPALLAIKERGEAVITPMN